MSGQILQRRKNIERKEEIPDIQNKKEVFRDPAHAAWGTYIGEPIYDEEPGEGQDCWLEQEIILAALGGNLNSPNIVHSEILHK